MSRTNMVTLARAHALFVSTLPTGAHPARGEVDAAIRDAVRSRGTVRECLAELATAYGERPETAAPRMSWARDLVEQTYIHRSSH